MKNAVKPSFILGCEQKLAKFYTFSICIHHSEYLVLTKNIPGTIISRENTESNMMFQNTQQW